LIFEQVHDLAQIFPQFPNRTPKVAHRHYIRVWNDLCSRQWDELESVMILWHTRLGRTDRIAQDLAAFGEEAIADQISWLQAHARL
jgi:hypothetical protein